MDLPPVPSRRALALEYHVAHPSLAVEFIHEVPDKFVFSVAVNIILRHLQEIVVLTAVDTGFNPLVRGIGLTEGTAHGCVIGLERDSRHVSEAARPYDIAAPMPKYRARAVSIQIKQSHAIDFIGHIPLANDTRPVFTPFIVSSIIRRGAWPGSLLIAI